MKTKTYIEVNGKRYDASTGKLIGDISKKHSAGSVIDGVAHAKPGHSVRPSPVHHTKKPQKSLTLMRHVVKKPAPTKRAAMSHEFGHTRSPIISRFGNSYRPVEPRVEPLMLAHSKEELEKLHQTTIESQVVSRPQSKSESLITKAIESADAHNLPKHAVKKHSRTAKRLGISHKTARLGSSLVAVLLLGTFFAYQNVPNFAMRVAATRAGFDAKMPGYHPGGFGFRGPVEYKSGEVVVKFGSNTGDGRNFALTQKTSEWNNDALLANFVLNNDSQYQTFQDSTKTIFIYDRSNATWVEDGVWYRLEGNAELTTDQISRLANSL